MVASKGRKTSFMKSVRAKPVNLCIPSNCLEILGQGVQHLLKVSKEVRGKNSDYKGREIKLANVCHWENFVTMEDIKKLWKETPGLEEAMKRYLTEEEKSRYAPNPIQGRIMDERDLDSAWRANVQVRLNLVFTICAHELGMDSYPRLSGGDDATWISDVAEPGIDRKKPDFSGSKYEECDPEFATREPENIFNRIPGECKMAGKFGSRFVPPNGEKYKKKIGLGEAKKVLSQIHGYMDSHDARYGYIVTDEELIVLRRRDTGWGQLDVSPPIPHRGADPGSLNSLYVMWYIHWKYALDESPTGWRLRSFGQQPAPIVQLPPPRNNRATGKRADELKKGRKIIGFTYPATQNWSHLRRAGSNRTRGSWLGEARVERFSYYGSESCFESYSEGKPEGHGNVNG